MVNRSPFNALDSCTPIAPISSWAAAVSGFVPGEDGMSVFVRAIPYNYFALLTIVMMVSMVLMKEEFGAMIHTGAAVASIRYASFARDTLC